MEMFLLFLLSAIGFTHIVVDSMLMDKFRVKLEVLSKNLYSLTNWGGWVERKIRAVAWIDNRLPENTGHKLIKIATTAILILSLLTLTYFNGFKGISYFAALLLICLMWVEKFGEDVVKCYICTGVWCGFLMGYAWISNNPLLIAACGFASGFASNVAAIIINYIEAKTVVSLNDTPEDK